MKQGYPCHGPIPWPTLDDGNEFIKDTMSAYTNAMRYIGDRLMPLIALGLGMPENALEEMMRDSWGHLRVIRYPDKHSCSMPGITSHTDYGMFVLSSQDEVGGLW